VAEEWGGGGKTKHTLNGLGDDIVSSVNERCGLRFGRRSDKRVLGEQIKRDRRSDHRTGQLAGKKFVPPSVLVVVVVVVAPVVAVFVAVVVAAVSVAATAAVTAGTAVGPPHRDGREESMRQHETTRAQTSAIAAAAATTPCGNPRSYATGCRRRASSRRLAAEADEPIVHSRHQCTRPRISLDIYARGEAWSDGGNKQMRSINREQSQGKKRTQCDAINRQQEEHRRLQTLC